MVFPPFSTAKPVRLNDASQGGPRPLSPDSFLLPRVPVICSSTLTNCSPGIIPSALICKDSSPFSSFFSCPASFFVALTSILFDARRVPFLSSIRVMAWFPARRLRFASMRVGVLLSTPTSRTSAETFICSCRKRATKPSPATRAKTLMVLPSSNLRVKV